ncbi:unnamed protein product [Candidula unifasciata]|uniref:Rab-3A-interacting protein n=1 Tax=Candidula unifasciata TaxID=100452 RepID=A0A8S3ZD00_9EUPU|nr:unnamed protein product [Candidula unifasciata]
MPRSQQPLFEILSQAGQDRIDTVGYTNQSIAYRTSTGDMNLATNVENLDHSSCLISAVQDTDLSSAKHVSGLPLSDQEQDLAAVTLRREMFSTTCRSEKLNPDNVPENSASELGANMSATKDSHSPGSSGAGSGCNGTSPNIHPDTLQASSSCQVITNGSGGLAKDHKSDSADSAFDVEEPLTPNFDFLADMGGCDLRRPQPYPFRQTNSELIISRRMSLVSVKERGYARLEMELSRAQKALERKDEEVDELRGIRERLMKEVSDFTAALFEEVNSQLNDAALSEQQARRQLKEAESKIEVLTAEVAALKDLVLTSTPSSPNKHLHPQIDTTSKKDKLGKPFWKTHRRSTSHHQFTKESREMKEATEQHSLLKELDTVVFDEFIRWRLQPTMEFNGQFFARVQREDIQPCLSFRNTQLADRLVESVRTNTLSIEPIPGDQSLPRKCCLSESHKLCNYKIKFEGDDEWYYISQMSRNRITAVCDFYAYLRYIVQGLVKCSDKDIFAELVRLRNQMTQARLGLV